MINYETTYKTFGVILMMVPFYGCIEEFQTEFVEFESALVVDATITNQMETQKVLISRTFRFNENSEPGEKAAQVWVIAADGTRYAFNEGAAGEYNSEIQFAAEPEMDYHVSITTKDGRAYRSSPDRFTTSTKIDSLYAERIITDLGEEGMAIMIDASDGTEDASFYRYEYEESYKIVAPEFSSRDLDFVPGEGFVISPRPLDEKVCFTTDLSNRLILANTRDLDEDRLSRFTVRFINRDNYIITHRYSILVRQLTQSEQAHNFYETLSNFSSSESVFSETQPGFLEGNVFSEDDSAEKVLGYFDVAAVDEKRIFFNYEDFFPGEDLPPYVDPCVYGAPPIDKLPNMLALNVIKFINENTPGSGATGSGPYVTVPTVCGDCTVLGKPEAPEFWIE
ncbi:DUF4249 domain-containing protein [Muricauda sp. 2012CJ35-5]|uniref:DUF4249 domain-containing protein n=1 Tax=Flagellimonas spongiicola TaxID=2942208 RepID=A0ABT0PQF8_9FLAO|nr:DUF4249 domain-containing protein [Allomuricauda spongiicola]MCL6273206.1 DUF4249 domain-containing protein [Allomuricauda spongiicola]